MMKTFLPRIKEFFNYLKNEKIGLFYHDDGDGICSAVIAAKAVKRLRGKEPDLISYSGQRLKHIVDFAKREDITKLIAVDLTLDSHKKAIEEIEKFAGILIIDHHEFEEDINSENTIQIKPELYGEKGGAANPACKLTYEVLKEVIAISDLDWVAAAGIISDSGYSQNKDFIDHILKKYNYEVKDDIFKTKLGEVSKLIGYACAAGEINECYEVLSNSETPEDFLNSKLKQYKDEVEKEVNYFVANYKKLAEFHEDVVFYNLETKYRLKSLIANILSNGHPNITFFVFQEQNERYMISARRQDGKVELNKIMAKATKHGGGHIKASGGSIEKQDLDTFKKRILELL